MKANKFYQIKQIINHLANKKIISKIKKKCLEKYYFKLFIE